MLNPHKSSDVHISNVFRQQAYYMIHKSYNQPIRYGFVCSYGYTYACHLLIDDDSLPYMEVSRVYRHSDLAKISIYADILHYNNCSK